MYDSLMCLNQALDNSKKKTSILRDNGFLHISIETAKFIFPYDQKGISKAISALENKL